MLDKPVTTSMENCCAGDDFDGVFLCCPFSHKMA